MAESPTTGVVPLDEDPREGGGLGKEAGRKWDEDGRDREKSTVTALLKHFLNTISGFQV